MVPRRHPKGLLRLCLTEGFERFSFYGLQAILALYLVNDLLLPGRGSRVWLVPMLERSLGLSGQALASAIIGIYGALVAVAPLAGGIIADRVLGQRRAILAGGGLTALGHGMMIVDSALLPALVCIAAGSGLFRGPITAQVSELYPTDDNRRVEGFQWFFVSINLGGLAAPMVIGTLGERIGWQWGFAGTSMAMLAAIAAYVSGRRSAATEFRAISESAGGPLPARPRGTGAAQVLLAILVALVTVPNFQITNAYLMWADKYFALKAFGFDIPTSWLIALDGVLGLCALFVTGLAWRLWENVHGAVDASVKACVGGVFVVAGCLCLAIAASSPVTQPVGLGWPLGFQLLNSIGLAQTLPASLAIFGQLARPGRSSTAMSGYYLAFLGGSLLSGVMAMRFEQQHAMASWLSHAGFAVTATVGLWFLHLLLRRMAGGSPASNQA